MNDDPADLGDLEREVMQLVWQHGPLSADGVRERLGRPLKESTVRTVLKRLEDKHYVAHTTEGRTFIYRAVEERGVVAAKAIKRLIDWFCNGAVDEVLVGMVDAAVLDPEQLRVLSEKIEQAKVNNKRRG